MARLTTVFLILCAAAASAEEREADIGPDAWRALTEGKTLHYYKDGELFGREYYAPDGDRVIFRFPQGQCAEGRWAYADGQYCFAYVGELHCFEHVLRGDDIFVKGVEDGSEQTVGEIVDNQPLSCAEAIDS